MLLTYTVDERRRKRVTRHSSQWGGKDGNVIFLLEEEFLEEKHGDRRKLMFTKWSVRVRS